MKTKAEELKKLIDSLVETASQEHVGESEYEDFYDMIGDVIIDFGDLVADLESARSRLIEQFGSDELRKIVAEEPEITNETLGSYIVDMAERIRIELLNTDPEESSLPYLLTEEAWTFGETMRRFKKQMAEFGLR